MSHVFLEFIIAYSSNLRTLHQQESGVVVRIRLGSRVETLFVFHGDHLGVNIKRGLDMIVPIIFGHFVHRRRLCFSFPSLVVPSHFVI